VITHKPYGSTCRARYFPRDQLHGKHSLTHPGSLPTYCMIYTNTQHLFIYMMKQQNRLPSNYQIPNTFSRFEMSRLNVSIRPIHIRVQWTEQATDFHVKRPGLLSCQCCSNVNRKWHNIVRRFWQAWSLPYLETSKTAVICKQRSIAMP